MSALGAALKPREDPAMLRGETKYTADITLPGMLHAEFLRSAHGHATIRGIDVSAASAMPGVVRVITAQDVASHGEGRRALVVITDGIDTASRETADAVIARSRALDVPIYAVSVVARRRVLSTIAFITVFPLRSMQLPISQQRSARSCSDPVEKGRSRPECPCRRRGRSGRRRSPPSHGSG